MNGFLMCHNGVTSSSMLRWAERCAIGPWGSTNPGLASIPYGTSCTQDLQRFTVHTFPFSCFPPMLWSLLSFLIRLRRCLSWYVALNHLPLWGYPNERRSGAHPYTRKLVIDYHAAPQPNGAQQEEKRVAHVLQGEQIACPPRCLRLEAPLFFLEVKARENIGLNIPPVCAARW
jgi:hypothetical protein